MDKLELYRQYVQQVLSDYARVPMASSEYESQLSFDTTRDHYSVLVVGWKGSQRRHGQVIHVDIKNGQIWIQHDGTERGIANDFLALGVPKTDIVLAFHAPEMRPYTGFATGNEAA